MARPRKKSRVSPISMATKASSKTAETLRVPEAAAAPPAISANAAGMGKPMASASTTEKMSTYPWCAISEKRLFTGRCQYK